MLEAEARSPAIVGLDREDPLGLEVGDHLVISRADGSLREPPVHQLAPIVVRHRDVVGVIEPRHLAPLGYRGLEGAVTGVIMVLLHLDIALACEGLDPIGEGKAGAREHRVQGRHRLGPQLMVGLDRGDVEVAVDRLLAFG